LGPHAVDTNAGNNPRHCPAVLCHKNFFVSGDAIEQ
jgi:hypothetical protein